MTETTNQTITFEGQEYNVADLSPEQVTLANHCIDVERKIAAAQFQLQQLQVTNDVFVKMLREALAKKASDEPQTP